MLVKIYRKSSLCSTVSGEDLFWGNRFPRESWGFNAIEPFKEVIPDFTVELCEGFKWADNVPLVVFALEERDSSGFLCQDISMDFWFRFFFDLKRFSFPTSPCIFGLTFDSIGTSFPSTWFVKTKVTWNNISFDLSFSKGNHYKIYTSTRTHTHIYISSLPLMDNGHDICLLFQKICHFYKNAKCSKIHTDVIICFYEIFNDDNKIWVPEPNWERKKRW